MQTFDVVPVLDLGEGRNTGTATVSYLYGRALTGYSTLKSVSVYLDPAIVFGWGGTLVRRYDGVFNKRVAKFEAVALRKRVRTGSPRIGERWALRLALRIK